MKTSFAISSWIAFIALSFAIVWWLLYSFILTAPHCAEWHTIRQITPPYVEYDWNIGQQKMVQVIVPEETHYSWNICAEPVR